MFLPIGNVFADRKCLVTDKIRDVYEYSHGGDKIKGLRKNGKGKEEEEEKKSVERKKNVENQEKKK